MDVWLDQVDERWLENLKEYFLNCKQFKSKEIFLDQNTAKNYFNKVIASINQAERERLIDFNPTRNIKRIPDKETWREYLTLDELKNVARLLCEDPLLKRAALFSALTGLRWSDVRKVEEAHIYREVMYFRYRQKKVKAMETKYLSVQALGHIL